MTHPIHPRLLPLLRDPADCSPLRFRSGAFTGGSETVYPLQEGIPDFRLPGRPLLHRVWAWVYNRTAFGYDFGARFGWRLALGGAPLERRTFTDRIEISPGRCYLETAVGTGENIRHLAGEAVYVGVDQSLGMLRRSRVKLAGTHPDYVPVLADMAHLPFDDESFDGVFHLGGLQFLSNPRRAVEEMVRVAKPGSAVVIADELAALGRILRRGTAVDLAGLAGSAPAEVRTGTLSEGELFLLQIHRKHLGKRP